MKENEKDKSIGQGYQSRKTWSKAYNEKSLNIQNMITKWIGYTLIKMFHRDLIDKSLLKGDYLNGLPDERTTRLIVERLEKYNRINLDSLSKKRFRVLIPELGVQEAFFQWLLGNNDRIHICLSAWRTLIRNSDLSLLQKLYFHELPWILDICGFKEDALAIAAELHDPLSLLLPQHVNALPHFQALSENLEYITFISKDVIEIFHTAFKFASYIKNEPPAGHDIPGFLILGETGTGKESLAKFIADILSPGRFKALNCFGYDSNILPVELFGSVKGAFTGAVNKSGLFENVEGGTVFLDEIDGLDEKSQGMLLRVIQERQVRRLGSNADKKVKFNLICASNKSDLTEELTPDLYSRISAFPLYIPPLRERKEDIEEIAVRFVADHLFEKQKKSNPESVVDCDDGSFYLFDDKLSEEYGYDPNILKDFIAVLEKLTGKVVKREPEYHSDYPTSNIYCDAFDFISDAVEALKEYSWPGNVRELKDLLRKLIILSGGERITNDIVRKYLKIDHYSEITTPKKENVYPFKEFSLEEMEKRHIKEILQSTNTKTEAANILGIAPDTLRRKRIKYHLK